VKRLVIAAVLCVSLDRAAAAPSCDEAGSGAMRSSVSAKLYVHYHAVLDAAGSKQCRVNRWSARARACFARLTDTRSDRAYRRCLSRLTVAQMIAFRDALGAEIERIEQHSSG
jgi:hypothetical protein